MNMILHGIEAPNIIHTNTLTENLADIQEKDRVDVVMANPPFGGARRSPPKFDGQLHVELLTGPKAGRSVEIAYSVVNLAETGQTRAVVKADVFCARKVHRSDT